MKEKLINQHKKALEDLQINLQNPLKENFLAKLSAGEYINLLDIDDALTAVYNAEQFKVYANQFGFKNINFDHKFGNAFNEIIKHHRDARQDKIEAEIKNYSSQFIREILGSLTNIFSLKDYKISHKKKLIAQIIKDLGECDVLQIQVSKFMTIIQKIENKLDIDIPQDINKYQKIFISQSCFKNLLSFSENLKNSLSIVIPKVIENYYEGGKRFYADYIKLSNIPTTSDQKIYIHAFQELILDKNFDSPGTSLFIIAPLWRANKDITINLSGKEGHNYYNKASNGYGYGGKGSDGSPGGLGYNGGNFYGIGEEFNFNGLVTIISRGGSGGRGQDGGNGSDGYAASTSSSGVSRNDSYIGSYETDYKEFFCIKRVVYVYKKTGALGGRGGDAGQGGAGGEGGYPGIIEITFHDSSIMSNYNKIASKGSQGYSGNPGNPGKGGKNADHIIGKYDTRDNEWLNYNSAKWNLENNYNRLFDDNYSYAQSGSPAYTSNTYGKAYPQENSKIAIKQSILKSAHQYLKDINNIYNNNIIAKEMMHAFLDPCMNNMIFNAEKDPLLKDVDLLGSMNQE